LPANVTNCPNCGSELLLQGRYQVICPLAQGGFGQTFEVVDVRDPTVSKEGTPKILKVLVSDHQKAIALFQREARVLSQLRHPGIPRVEADGYFKFWHQESPEPLHGLVMEKIEGINLKDWLSDRQNQPITSEKAIAWITQLTEILQQVHQRQYFHRDIKPSNIMKRPNGQLVLIDFGAVREVTETYLRQESGGTVLISPGYTPPEQANGRAVEKSDFFALGRTFVHLLTGIHPLDLPENPETGQLDWRSHAPQVSPKLADLIDRLMAKYPENRPKDTQEIWQLLPEIQQQTKSATSRKKWLVLIISTIFCSGVGGVVLLQHQWQNSPNSCPVNQGDHLSCGEEILFPTAAPPEKQKGVKAFAQGNYQNAIQWLVKARQKQPNDPEILIYLNNAQLAGKPSHKIAAVVPISGNPFTAQEILWGVAQAQNEVNQGQKIRGKGLLVEIGDDANTPEQAKEIAGVLASDSDILAVIGHYASEVTLAAVGVYQQHQLVMISPTSTSEDLSSINQGNSIFFRTVPSDRISAQALSGYLSNQIRQPKVAIFYNPQSNFSKSLRDQFHASYSGSGGEIVTEFANLSDPFLNASQAINQAQKQGVTTLVLFPDGQTDPFAFRNALKIVKANQGRYWIAGGDSLYSSEVLQLVAPETLTHFVVPIPWHPLNSPNSQFPQTANNLWREEVTWRTALAYDATQALIAALEDLPNPDRILLQKTLRDANFQTTGATGVISFQVNGNRSQPISELIKVIKTNCSVPNYRFVPVTTPATQVKNFKCPANSAIP